MKIHDSICSIINEIQICLGQTDEESILKLEQYIKTANRIFITGTGRSLLMGKAFGMRLMQINYPVFIVGDVTTPAITDKDLLIIISGSGNTKTLVTIAKKCKSIGADIVLITTNEQPDIKDAALTIIIPTVTPKSNTDGTQSAQVGANTFEQSVLILGDTVVCHLSRAYSVSQTNELIMKNHSNLE